MTDYISTPISVLNDDLNAVQTTLEAKADKSEITAFITEDALSDYATETYVQEYVAEHSGTPADMSACLSTDEFTTESYLPADPFGELDVNSVSLVDLGNKLNKVIQLLKRDANGPGGDPAKTYLKYSDGSISALDIVGEIGVGAIPNVDNLIQAKIGNTVTSIADGNLVNRTFAHAPLTAVSFPNSLTSIGDSAFDDCTQLSSVKIPNGVLRIGNDAFNETPITSIEIPDSVIEVGSSAFGKCLSLSSAAIGNGVTRIGSNAFEQNYYTCPLKYVHLGNSLSSIGSECFKYTRSLRSFSIPSSVVEIGSNAFYKSYPNPLIMEGKTMAEVQAMANYRFGLTSFVSISCTDGTL